MIRPSQISQLGWLLVLSLLIPTARAAAPRRAHKPVVREQVEVEFMGSTEKWRLQWASAPTRVCDVGGPEWTTCLCAGFAFGEEGELELVRSVGSRPEERLRLSPYFDDQENPGQGGKAVLSRWPHLPEDDARAADPKRKAPSVVEIHSRRPVRILNLHDFDHDGWATEFMLQVGAGPCGHQASILVGISYRAPTLHAFGTAEHPKTPLVLPPRAWRRLRDEKPPLEVVDVACGDHGSAEESVFFVSADSDGLHATEKTYGCGEGFKRGKLLSQKVL